jgi:hypothetical protein
MRRLEGFPRGLGPIGSDWQDALGDLRRVANWTALFGREIGEQPWRKVLNSWWPRLLPGVVAAATHGVIRVGHAVRALLAAAAAAAVSQAHSRTPLESLSAVPRVAGQSGAIRDRLARLGDLAAGAHGLQRSLRTRADQRADRRLCPGAASTPGSATRAACRPAIPRGDSQRDLHAGGRTRRRARHQNSPTAPSRFSPAPATLMPSPQPSARNN